MNKKSTLIHDQVEFGGHHWRACIPNESRVEFHRPDETTMTFHPNLPTSPSPPSIVAAATDPSSLGSSAATAAYTATMTTAAAAAAMAAAAAVEEHNQKENAAAAAIAALNKGAALVISLRILARNTLTLALINNKFCCL